MLNLFYYGLWHLECLQPFLQQTLAIQPSYSVLDNVPKPKGTHSFESHSAHKVQSNDSTHIIQFIEWMEVHTDYKIL